MGVVLIVVAIIAVSLLGYLFCVLFRGENI